VTKGVFSSTNATITASFLAAARTADITVLPVSLKTFTISPQQLKAGQTATGTLTLDAPAPAGGLVVTLNFNKDLFSTFPANQTITIPAGQTSGTFTLVPKQLSVPVNATITATAGEVTKSVVLSILR
jgi:shikimate kinase